MDSACGECGHPSDHEPDCSRAPAAVVTLWPVVDRRPLMVRARRQAWMARPR